VDKIFGVVKLMQVF